jgi:carbon storage regulator
MLVLSRKVGESIVIAENIEVQVVEVKGNKVRLGIVAPRDVSVDRKEVAESKATNPAPAPLRVA